MTPPPLARVDLRAHRQGAAGRLRDRLASVPLGPLEFVTDRDIAGARAALRLATVMTRPTPANVLHLLADEITRAGAR